MTPLERYLAVCNGQLPDRAPVSPFIMQFAARVAGVSYRDYCLHGEIMAQAQITCSRRFGYDSVNVTSDAVREYQALGGPVADFGEESVPAAEPERDGIWLLNDLSAAQAEARKTGKPICVVFRCER